MNETSIAQHITVDFDKLDFKNDATNIQYKESDIKSTRVDVKCLFKGQPIDLTGMNVLIRLQSGMNIVEDSITTIDMNTATLSYILPTNALVRGINHFEIMLMKNGDWVKTSPKIYYRVYNAIMDGGIESDNQYPIIVGLIEDVRALMNKVELLDKTLSDAEKIRVSNEIARVVAENDRLANETNRINAENIRISSENTRITNETNRINAENIRISNETDRLREESIRITNEIDRVNQETIRVSSEIIRESNELDRINNETIRESNEVIRVNSEITRESNEVDRIDNEIDRIDAENIRISNENDRLLEETIRVTNENDRLANELDRVDSEIIRKSNEIDRIDAENIRISNENDRLNIFSTLESDMITATNDAVDKIVDCEDRMVIIEDEFSSLKVGTGFAAITYVDGLIGEINDRIIELTTEFNEELENLREELTNRKIQFNILSSELSLDNGLYSFVLNHNLNVDKFLEVEVRNNSSEGIVNSYEIISEQSIKIFVCDNNEDLNIILQYNYNNSESNGFEGTIFSHNMLLENDLYVTNVIHNLNTDNIVEITCTNINGEKLVFDHDIISTNEIKLYFYFDGVPDDVIVKVII